MAAAAENLIPKQFTLQTLKGYTLCAEKGGGAECNINRGHIQAWETFEAEHIGDDIYAFKASNGQYLCVDHGNLVANRPRVGDWEKFKVERHGEHIAIRTHTGKYLSANSGGGSSIAAKADHVKAWEKFDVVEITPSREYFYFLHHDRSSLSKIINHSSNPIYVKNENNDSVFLINPGDCYDGAIDGISIPARAPNQILKVTDPCNQNIEITNEKIIYNCALRKIKDIELPFGIPAVGDVLDMIKGGWLNAPPDNKWNKLFETSKPSSAPSRDGHHRDDPDDHHRSTPFHDSTRDKECPGTMYGDRCAITHVGEMHEH